MRILLIGNFSPPYEEENLHNLTLLNHLKQEGNECRVINIAESSLSRAATQDNKEIINIRNYFDFIIKLIRYGFRCDVIHFLTKGYTRPGLLKLVTAVFIGRVLLSKPIITLHPELFSILGRLRSKMGGQQLLRLSFSLAHRIICGDKPTMDIAFMHCTARDKFVIIPPFLKIPVVDSTLRDDITADEHLFLKKLENKKKIIVFLNVRYPSLLFDILNAMLADYPDSETAVAVSLSDENSQKLQNVIKDAGKNFADNIVFIEPGDMRRIMIAYSRADLMLRTLSCDGRALFEDIALSIKKPAYSGKYLYFPLSLSIIKEGEAADLCAGIFKFLMEETVQFTDTETKDFYRKTRDTYLE
jgi:hypothetical protein